MKFSAFLLVAVVTAASANLQSAPKVIDPTQHNSEGSRVWAGNSVGFLTLVSAIPSSNLPNVAQSSTPEDPQFVETQDGAMWWGFKALPPIADYSKAIFATSTDHRIWVSFKDNAISDNNALHHPIVDGIEKKIEKLSASDSATLATEKHPLDADGADFPAVADIPSNISARSGIWWGYPDGDFGKSPRSAIQEERETSTSTAASPHIEKRIWWGYPEGDFGKSRKNVEPSHADATDSNTKATEAIVESANNIFWALPPKDARSVPEKAVVGHDAKGRVWWGYPVDASKPTEQDGDGGIAIDKDGTQFRIYWGYPDSKENNIKNETAAKSLAEALNQDNNTSKKGEKGILIAAAPSTKKTSSIFGAIKDLFPLGHESTEVAAPAVVSEGVKNGDHDVSAIKKGEMERKQRAEALIRMVETQTDEVLREELGHLAENLLDDLREYRLNAAASENAKGSATSKAPLAASVSTLDAAAVGTGAVGAEIDAGDLSKEEMNRRFEELKSKYEKLLNVVGKSA